MVPFEALGSQATFAHVLYDGAEFGHAGEVHVGSEEEMDFLGIPGLLEPDQVRSLLQETRAANYPASRCRPSHVDGFRVYVPNSTRAQYVAHPTTGCGNRNVHLLTHGAYRRP